MSETNENVEKRIESIESRLVRIEQQLHLIKPQEMASQTVQQDSPAGNPVSVVPLATTDAAAKLADRLKDGWEVYAAPPEPAVGLPNSVHATPPPLPTAHASAVPANVIPPPRIANFQQHRPMKRQNQTGLEQTIGLKWAGWLGAIVLLIGAALGVKYAYDQRWFAAMPVWVWPSIIAAIGLALIAVGEIVYRRVHVIPAASLFAAGIATLFLDSYVGHSYYAIYSPSTAFALMAATAWIGSAVAMRGRTVSIAVLSQIGGSIAPMVMGDSGAPHTTFMSYLLMLEVIALVLAWWGRSPRWWVLRGISLATTALWMTAIIVPGADGQLPLVFAIVYALLYQLETILSSMRADVEPQWTHIRHNGAAFTTFVTALLTTAMLGVLHNSPTILQTTWIGVFALFNAVTGFVLPTKDRPLTKALTIAYRACAVALLAVAVPVQMHGLSVEVAWGLLAIVLAIIGWYLQSGISRVGSVVVWIAALVHLLMSLPTIGALNAESHMKICMTIGRTAITSAAMLAWGLALVGQVIAELHLTVGEKPEADKDRNAVMISSAASVVWVVTSVVALPLAGSTFMLLIYAWLIGAMARFLPRLQTWAQFVAILIFATGKWMLIDTLRQSVTDGWPASTSYFPLVNSTIDLGLILAATLLCVAWIRRKSTDATFTWAFGMLGLLVVAWTITFEIDRAFSTAAAARQFTDPQLAKQVAFSIAWSFFAVIAVAAGFRVRMAGLRYFGLGLLAVTLLKVVTVDLGQVSTGYRILSFLALGAIMLGTSVLYGKLSPKLLAASNESV